MLINVNVTKSELKLIEEARKNELDRMAREEKKRNCVHTWVYDGHGHNSDWERCSNCNETREY